MNNIIDYNTLTVALVGVLINPIFLLLKTMIISSYFELERNFENRISRYEDLKVSFLAERGLKELLIKLILPYSMILDMLIACYQADRFLKAHPNADTLDWLICDLKQKLAVKQR